MDPVPGGFLRTTGNDTKSMRESFTCNLFLRPR
jgi:hypothetical protein